MVSALAYYISTLTTHSQSRDHSAVLTCKVRAIGMLYRHSVEGFNAPTIMQKYSAIQSPNALDRVCRDRFRTSENCVMSVVNQFEDKLVTLSTFDGTDLGATWINLQPLSLMSSLISILHITHRKSKDNVRVNRTFHEVIRTRSRQDDCQLPGEISRLSLYVSGTSRKAAHPTSNCR
jgi:hypothetical protein